jgi:hypothetical protein
MWPGIVASMQGGVGAAKVAAAAKAAEAKEAATKKEREKQARETEKARQREKTQNDYLRRQAGESERPKADRKDAEQEPRKPAPFRRTYEGLLRLSKAELHTRSTRTDGTIFELNRQMRRLKGEIRKLDDEDNSQEDRQNDTGRREWSAWGTTLYSSSASGKENSEGKLKSERLKLNQGHSRRIKENELRNLQERLYRLEDELRAINERIDAMKPSSQASQSSMPKSQWQGPHTSSKPNSSSGPKQQSQQNSSSPRSSYSSQSKTEQSSKFDEWRQQQENARMKQEQQRQEDVLKKMVEELQRREAEAKRLVEEQQRQAEAENAVQQLIGQIAGQFPASSTRLYGHMHSARQQGSSWTQILLSIQQLELEIRLEAILLAAVEREQERREEQRHQAAEEELLRMMNFFATEDLSGNIVTRMYPAIQYCKQQGWTCEQFVLSLREQGRQYPGHPQYSPFLYQPTYPQTLSPPSPQPLYLQSAMYPWNQPNYSTHVRFTQPLWGLSPPPRNSSIP